MATQPPPLGPDGASGRQLSPTAAEFIFSASTAAPPPAPPTKRQIKRQRKNEKKRAATDAASKAAAECSAAAPALENTAGEGLAAAGPGGSAPPSGKGKRKGESSAPGNNRGDGRPSAPGNPAAAGAWGKVTKGTPPPPASARGKPPAPHAAVSSNPPGRGKDKAGMLPAAPPHVWGRTTQPGGGGAAAKPEAAGNSAGASRRGKGGRQNPAGTKGPLKPPRAGGKKGDKTGPQSPGGQPDPTAGARGKGNAASAGAAEAAGYPTLAYKARSGPAAYAGPLPAGLLKVPRGVIQPPFPTRAEKIMSYGAAVRKVAVPKPKPKPQPAATSAKAARSPTRAKGKNIRDEQEEAFPSLGSGGGRTAAVARPPRPPKGQVSAGPGEMSLGDVLFHQLKFKDKASQKSKGKGKHLNLAGGGGGVLSRAEVGAPPTARKGKVKEIAMPSNPLDSTGPVKKRGKERERPKKKKLSELKKVIINERNAKKALRDAKRAKDRPVWLGLAGEIEELEDNIKTITKVLMLLCHTADDGDDPAAQEDEDEDASLEVPETAEERALRLHMVDRFQAANRLHSRKFREYCSHSIDEELNKLTKELLKRLQAFQDRARLRDPQKAKSKRRIVVGMREVTKLIERNKLKAVLIAPDIEKIRADGGLDEMLATILELCRVQQIPALFCLTRRKLGRALKKAVPVSVVGVIDYQGAQDIFKDMQVRFIVATEKFSLSKAVDIATSST